MNKKARSKKRIGSWFKVLDISRFKIESILITCFLFCFTLMIIAQLLMTNPDTRVFLTQEEKVEGVFLGDSEKLIDKGILILELQYCDKIEGLWVWVNGQRTANFDSKQLTLSVKDADVIEIDSTEANAAATIKIISCSENVELLIDNSGEKFNKKIGVLARVKLQ